MMKRAFTILELIVSISILAVLMTIVTIAAANTMQSARENRRDTMLEILREGVNNYYARNGEWPGDVESKAQAGVDYVFRDGEADRIFQHIVKESIGKNKNPYLDPHALFVAPIGVDTNRSSGISFNEARVKAPHRRAIGIEEMAFGFPDPATGHFQRYAIQYTAAMDAITIIYP